MPHAPVNDLLGIGFAPLVTADVNGIPTFVPLMQVQFRIQEDGTLAKLKEQPPPNVSGEWYGDPEFTSLKFEPQIAYRKLATDVVLHGDAYPATPGGNRGQLGIRVGPVQKLAHVFGERRLVKRLGFSVLTDPEPFETIPITYERCFGGWDRRHENESKHSCESRNPAGVGYYDASLPADEDLAVPNIEDPQRPYNGYGDRPPPAGFGFLAGHWEPRVRYGGTYDKQWDATRKPLLPEDFDLRFFNAASAGLVAPAHLKGDEPVVVLGASPSGRVAFNLPGMSPPICMVEVRAQNRAPVATELDTVIVDMRSMTLSLVWRGHLQVRGGIHEVASVEIRADAAPDLDEVET